MNLFNRGAIIPGFPECKRTPGHREQEAAEIAQALARSRVKPTVVPGFAGIVPRPARSSWVDPETRLKRKAYGVSDAQRREAARDIAEHSKIIEMVDELEAV